MIWLVIRAAYPYRQIGYRPSYSGSSMLVRLTPEAFAGFKEGQFHGLDELNAYYGVVSSEIVSSHIQLILLRFDLIYNTKLLADIYESAKPEGLLYAEGNAAIGDGSTIVAEPPIIHSSMVEVTVLQDVHIMLSITSKSKMGRQVCCLCTGM